MTNVQFNGKNSQAAQAALDHAPIAIFRLDANAVIIEANAEACRSLGYTRQELIGMRIFAIDPTFTPELWLVHRQELNEQGSRRIETLHRRKDGTIFPVEVTVNFYQFQGDSYSYSFARDLTAYKNAQDAFKQVEKSNAQIRVMFESTTDGITFTDMAGSITQVNDAVVRMHEYSNREELIGKPALTLISPDEHARALAKMQSTFETGRSEIIEYKFITKNGRIFDAELNSILLKDSQARPSGFVALTRDISERKRMESARRAAEAQVRQLNEELEKRVADRTAQLRAANSELEAFAYSVSHDLRAPLRAINGYTQILIEDHGSALDENGQRVCSIINTEAQRMGHLIDDLLTFSRLGRAEMQVFPVDMNALVHTIYHELTTQEERKRIHFQMDPLPTAAADPVLIRQVWINLIANAIKFSRNQSQASIYVGSTPAPEEITFWVKDNGAGFDMRYADKLFGVFQRLHSEKEFEGTGVGLAIVQRVINRHGGRVWADSAAGLGATFSFTLPRKEETS